MMEADKPAVPRPTLAVPRARPYSKNELGCCITGGAHLAELAAQETAEREKAEQKEKKVADFWGRWREPCRDAEAKLRELGTPSKLMVGEMKVGGRTKSQDRMKKLVVLTSIDNPPP